VSAFHSIFGIVLGSLLSCSVIAAPINTRLDTTPCTPSFEAMQAANLMLFRQGLQEEMARSAPRQSRLEMLNKAIKDATSMGPLQYATRHEPPGSEFYPDAPLSSLNYIASQERKMMQALLANDMDAYRVVKGVTPSGPVQLASFSADEWMNMCVVLARISFITRKPTSKADQQLLEKFGNFVTGSINAAASSQPAPVAPSRPSPEARPSPPPAAQAQVVNPGAGVVIHNTLPGERRLTGPDGCLQPHMGEPTTSSGPGDCKPAPTYSTLLSHGQCIERARAIQLEWKQESDMAGSNGARLVAAERKAQLALKQLFQQQCAHHPDAAAWVRKADQTLRGETGAAAAFGSGGQGGDAGTSTDKYYTPIINCMGIRRAQNSNFTFCIANDCNRTLEAHFSGGMVSVGAGRCAPISAGPNPVFYAACEKNDGFDRATHRCRR
jgi:hypothetical protein